MSTAPAHKAAEWLEELGAISDDAPGLTRTFLSPALARAKVLVAQWMQEAGLTVFEDKAGNVIGRLECERAIAGTVACGSHLDTVRNAGKFDGALGVVTGVLAAANIIQSGRRLPYHLEIVAFSDEEGVRFQTTYLGSRYYAGRLGPTELTASDAQGTTIGEAIRNHSPMFPVPPPHAHLLGYVEAHIEQGPVLEKENLALGVVTAIAGQTRARVFLTGKAGHAGTTPMTLRQDALAGAAECILLVEQRAGNTSSLVATVGEIRVESGASNVIPGSVEFTLDVRDADNRARLDFCKNLFEEFETRMKRRGLEVRIEIPFVSPATQCSTRLIQSLASLVKKHQGRCPELVSGAGHDAVALSNITDVAMLFVRCRDGLSHHPDEFAAPPDIAAAVDVLTEFLSEFPMP